MPPFTAPVTFSPHSRPARSLAALLAVAAVVAAGLHLIGAPAARASSGTWRAASPMGNARSGHTATTLLDGRILVVGGTGPAGVALDSVEIYDPASGNWSTTSPLITARSGHAATLLADGRVLVTGGLGGASGVLASAEIYQPGPGPSDAHWSSAGEMSSPRFEHTATRLDGPACERGNVCGAVLIAGGRAQTGIDLSGTGSPAATLGLGLTTAELYRPAAGGPGSWNGVATMGAPRTQHTATLLPDGNVLVAGGVARRGIGIFDSYGDGLHHAELFDPTAAAVGGAWAPTGPMRTEHHNHTATLLPGGKILVAGGGNCFRSTADDGFGPHDFCPPVASSEIYDAVSRTWVPTGSMNERRFYHSATPLPGGKVLVAGGDGAGSAEIFDLAVRGTDSNGAPTLGGWAYTRSLMTSPRYDHTASLLSSGAVLAAGGTKSTFGDKASSTELFDPEQVSTLPYVARLTPAAGPTYGGSEVVIDGSGFGAVTGVSFGEVPAARYHVDSATRITATSPAAGEGTVEITVVTEAGRSASTGRSRFTYHQPNGYWMAAGEMNENRSGHTATRLADGRVLVAGGNANGVHDYLVSAEVFDPTTRSWTKAASMATPRSAHTATLLKDGRVLVVGGDFGRRTAEIYDPAADQWTSTRETVRFRWAHTATLLDDGSVLVTGAGTSAERYRPDAGPSGTWEEVAPMISSRERHTATRVGVQVLVAGGRNDTNSAAEIYNPSGTTIVGGASLPGEWQEAGTMAARRRDHIAVQLADGSVLVAGGAGKSSERYHGGQWRDGGAMTSERFDLAAATMEDGKRVLVAGGCCDDAASAEIYDATARSWSPTGRMGAERDRHSVTQLSGGTILAAGGNSSGPSSELFVPSASRPPVSVSAVDPPAGSTAGGTEVTITGTGFFYPGTKVSFGGVPAQRVTVISDNQAVAVTPPHPQGPVDVRVESAGLSPVSPAAHFSFAGGAWSESGAMATARFSHTITELPDGGVLVAGGRAAQGLGPLASAERYDTASRTWKVTGSMAVARFGHAATPLADGKILVAGGATCGRFAGSNPFDNSPICLGVLPGAEIYDPAIGVWRPTGSMRVGRSGHTATLLRDGRVLVVGGDAFPGVGTGERFAEIYDPVTGTWSTSGALSSGRFRHTATLLPDDRVLVAGGVQGSAALSSAVLFDPRQNKWSATDSLESGRLSASATVLPGNKVLVAGGAASGAYKATPLRSAEVFDVATGEWAEAPPMGTRRSGHTAITLAGGDVLVSGGSSNGAELYSPASGSWTPTSSMSTRRPLGPAALLGTGQALVAGGGEPFIYALSSSELYTVAPVVTAMAPDEGPSAGGTPVVVTGRNLEGATVSFGATPAAALPPISETQLTAATPAHQAGAVEVAVTTPGGRAVAPSPFRFSRSGVPGAVSDLAAEATSESEVKLSFSAPPSDGALPPPARRFVVKQSKRPIDTEAAFSAAPALCGGTCSFTPANVGDPIALRVKNLSHGTTYHFVVQALDEDSRPGPLSNSAQATTLGTANAPPGAVVTDCPAVTPVAGQVGYPTGYSLTGLPEGTVVGSDSPLYGWFNLGRGGTYSVLASTDAVAAGRGFWAWFSCPSAVTLSGAGANSVDSPLRSYNASMIGNPSGTASATVAGHDFAVLWNPSANDGEGAYEMSAYRAPQNLAVGEGAWVFSYRDTTVTIRAN